MCWPLIAQAVAADRCQRPGGRSANLFVADLSFVRPHLCAIVRPMTAVVGMSKPAWVPFQSRVATTLAFVHRTTDNHRTRFGFGVYENPLTIIAKRGTQVTGPTFDFR